MTKIISDVDTFADWLMRMNVKFYSSDWCPGSAEQIDKFEEEALDIQNEFDMVKLPGFPIEFDHQDEILEEFNYVMDEVLDDREDIGDFLETDEFKNAYKAGVIRVLEQLKEEIFENEHEADKD